MTKTILEDQRFMSSLKQNGTLFKKRFSNGEDILNQFLTGHFVTSSAPGLPYTLSFARYFERRAFARHGFIKSQPKKGYSKLSKDFKRAAKEGKEGRIYTAPSRHDLQLVANEYIARLIVNEGAK